jgi:glycosyltransferase involved in cell wall biosynthesis
VQPIPAAGAEPGHPRPPFSIIVACLNEEDTIIECLERLTRSVPEAEILVMHGGKDRTYERARDFAQSHPKVIAVRNENDRGKGSAVKAGIQRATFDVMCQFDADLQFEPEDMARVVAPIFERRADVVIGSRFMKGADASAYGFSFFRTLGNRVVNGWVSLLCGQSMTDVTTGYKAWTKTAMETIRFRDDGFVYEVEIPMRACMKGLRVVQVPVKYHDRQGGISGHGTGLREIWSLGMTGFRLLVTALAIRLRQ